MCVLYVNICPMCAVCTEARRGHHTHLDLELAAVMNSLTWVLGTKVRYPGRVSSKLVLLTPGQLSSSNDHYLKRNYLVNRK